MTAAATAPAQHVRVLPGRLRIDEDGDPDGNGVAAVVVAPDGTTVVRHDADGDWCALWTGGTAHGLDVPGMLVAVLAPLAEVGCAVFVCSTATADLVLVPHERLDLAAQALERAGHVVAR